MVSGVLTDASIAFTAARLAQEQGAEIVLTSPGRTARLTGRVAARLPKPAPVIELDVNEDADVAQLAGRVKEVLGEQVDGVLHAIGFAPPTAMGGNFLDSEWNDVAVALKISTYSLVSMVRALQPLLSPRASVVGLTFDASVAWPFYDWMGIAKAGLESASRYLATYLGPQGVRVNMVAAGPLRTTAMRNIPGIAEFDHLWDSRAPLGWNTRDCEAAGRACVGLLSDWFPATTGEIVHVDGGAHAVGG